MTDEEFAARVRTALAAYADKYWYIDIDTHGTDGQFQSLAQDLIDLDAESRRSAVVSAVELAAKNDR